MDNPLQPPVSTHISIRKSQSGFALRCACVMFGLSVSAALELLQLATSFLFLWFSHFCFWLYCTPSLPTLPPHMPCFIHLFIPPLIAWAALKTSNNMSVSDLLRAFPHLRPCLTCIVNCHPAACFKCDWDRHFLLRPACFHDSLLQEHFSHYFYILYLKVSSYKITLSVCSGEAY